MRLDGPPVCLVDNFTFEGGHFERLFIVRGTEPNDEERAILATQSEAGVTVSYLSQENLEREGQHRRLCLAADNFRIAAEAFVSSDNQMLEVLVTKQEEKVRERLNYIRHLLNLDGVKSFVSAR
jgi:hypothetical protein